MKRKKSHTKVTKDNFVTVINHAEGTQVVLEIGQHENTGFVNVIDVKKGYVRPVDPENLIEAFTSSHERSIVRTGRIPCSEDILEMSFVVPGDIKNVMTFVKGGSVNLKTKEKMYPDIIMPSCLFWYSLNGTKVLHTAIACLKDITAAEQIDDNTPVYRYPLMHIHQTGFTCWGNIELPPVNNLDVLKFIPGIFFNAEMNVTHLADISNNVSRMPMPLLLDKLSNKELLLNNILNPLDMNFKSYCNKMFGGAFNDSNG